jgi:hypothetical protein
VTVPVAEEDATVAVRVTVSATVGVVVEAVRVVVVDVSEDELTVMLIALEVLVA